jgi:hypothetical protein
MNRMVIALCAGGTSRSGLATAAQIAAAMGLDIEGLFIEDEELLGLAALPFVTELTPGSAVARPMEPARLEKEMRAAAGALQQALERAARMTRANWRFASVRGEIGAVLSTAAASGDVVAVLEPAGALNRATRAAVQLRRAAIRSPASVLYVPDAANWRHGTVVAVIGAEKNDNAEVLRKAVSIAAASKQQLLVFESTGARAEDAGLAKLMADAAMPARAVRLHRLADDSPEALARALRPISQSLLVLARGALGLDEEGELMRLAAIHRVPVLVLESAAEH